MHPNYQGIGIGTRLLAEIEEAYPYSKIADHYIKNLNPELLQYEKRLRDNWNQKIYKLLESYSRAPMSIIENIKS